VRTDAPLLLGRRRGFARDKEWTLECRQDLLLGRVSLPRCSRTSFVNKKLSLADPIGCYPPRARRSSSACWTFCLCSTESVLCWTSAGNSFWFQCQSRPCPRLAGSLWTFANATGFFSAPCSAHHIPLFSPLKSDSRLCETMNLEPLSYKELIGVSATWYRGVLRATIQPTFPVALPVSASSSFWYGKHSRR
jgi:hypothetical protein